jgi:hypothetical protein
VFLQSRQGGAHLSEEELEKRQKDALRMAKKMGEEKVKEDGMEHVPEIDDVLGQPPGGPILDEDQHSKK